IAFSIDDKGYVGAGYNGNYLKDFWMYDPRSGEWQQKVSISGSKRNNAFAFAIGGRGYVGSGIDNGTYSDELWEYDPAADIWIEKRDLIDEDDEYGYDPPSPRESAVAFVIGDKAYLCGGATPGTLGDLWEYDPSSDTWEQLEYLEGSARQGAAGFAVGGRGYITTGRSSSLRFDDLWELDPMGYEEE
ncbi:MAG TPA: kelch repeat-containing protein, partial [Anseongella sp.]|nr:kelch repeat-containing protein [Anseongella sp.]